MSRHWFPRTMGFALLLGCGITEEERKVEAVIPVDSGYAQIGPLKMYFEVRGEGGMPLVLIHGGGSTIASNWGRIINTMAEDRQVIAMELQAHGHTPDVPDRPTSFEQDADDVAGLLARLKVPMADLFGFSNGGNTAMQVAIRHPHLVNRLIVASSFYRRDAFPPMFWFGMDRATLAMMPAPLKEAYRKIDPDPAHLQAMFDRDRTRMLEFTDWPDSTLASIKAPTLLIVGEQDVVSVDHVNEMAGLIPNAEILVVDGGHGACIGEICTTRPDKELMDRTLASVEEFLDRSR